jgi:hypothetical protein
MADMPMLGDNHAGRFIDKYEQAAIDYDRSETERLKDFLREVDPEGEIRFVGKSVTDWAIEVLTIWKSD